MRTSRLTRLLYLLATPFDHQPIAIPTVPTARSVVQSVLPAKSELSRIDEVSALLKHLPAACDRAKELQHDAQYASRYYRARLHRGSQLQQRQMEQIVSCSPQEAQRWARGRLLPVTDPLNCS